MLTWLFIYRMPSFRFRCGEAYRNQKRNTNKQDWFSNYCSAHIDPCCFQISCLVRRLEANPSLIYNLIQVVKFIQKQRPSLRSFLSLNIFIPSMLLLEHSENPDSSGPITLCKAPSACPPPASTSDEAGGHRALAVLAYKRPIPFKLYCQAVLDVPFYICCNSNTGIFRIGNLVYKDR